ncbi:hypothetical protein BGZ65_008410 [Modicella reniformis]|uniref:Major facilitator superfamily (MFS) profile domain-containing protein n=1 Tax=Modicella reniformis TaxID=1440133 RepID=A0A9P6LW27_9FUNG|nr:hypothetical protein BGZ65_008410 [Modicella reniformis]
MAPPPNRSSPTAAATTQLVTKVTGIVFTALLIDILAFTLILPLFPRLLQFYRDSEHGDQTSLLAWSLSRLTEFQNMIGLDDQQQQQQQQQELGVVHTIKRPPKMDIVLLGGAIGSLFSVLQFIASPIIGKLSDVFGRRRVLLMSMIGNLIACAVWLFADSFELFVLSRIIGGLSEGNVQISIAMISDITTPATRSRGLAMVGIAFAIAFTIGPALGAYFANKDLVAVFPELAQYGLHPFSGSALLAIVLLTVETIYLYVKLPETHSESWRLAIQQQQTVEADERRTNGSSSNDNIFAPPPAAAAASASATTTTTATHANGTISAADRDLDDDSIIRLQHTFLSRLSFIHFAHLFLFSGMEFTLTFLTFHLFDFSHMQQGALLGYIGILSSLIQGGYVRRKANKVGEKRMVLHGMVASAIGLGCIALVSGDAIALVNAAAAAAAGGSTMKEESPSSPLGLFRILLTQLNAQNWSKATRMWVLYAGATGLAVTSATVVNCLTSLASLVCDMGSDGLSKSGNGSGAQEQQHHHQPIGKGLALGRFRSWGQLGRAAGPIAACSLYWRVGPLVCYGIGSLGVVGLVILSTKILPEVRKLPIRTRAAVSKKTQ